LDGFRALRRPEERRQIDRDLEVFVAEGTMVLRSLVTSTYRVRAVLASVPRAHQVEGIVAGVDAPLYVADPEVLARAAGFAVHRGVVALGERRPFPLPTHLAEHGRLLLVAEGVGDHENLGALYRNAAAFGVDGVLLDPATVDPFYRRSLRVSMGHVMHVPTAREVDWPGGVARLRALGWTVLALTPAADAEPIGRVVDDLDRLASPLRVALMVGAEGPGLSAGALGAADRRVRIPMVATVDSVNVATAAAIALHRLAAVDPG
jgi:tRNA G18 (ribose-2'-O)-methylase SpoU